MLRPDGQVLLAQRPPGKAYAGYWEFPGRQARGRRDAARTRSRASCTKNSASSCAARRRGSCRNSSIRTRTSSCTSSACSRGTASCVGHDGQAFAWQTPGRYTVAPLLPANTRILAALELPPVYGITLRGGRWARTAFLARAERAFAAGLRLVQLRDKDWPLDRASRAGAALCCRSRGAFGARVLLNGTVDDARAAGCDGVHWTAAALAAATVAAGRPARRARRAIRASEIARAGALDLDFAVLGPVAATPTHPHAPPLGWDGFARMHRRNARCRSTRWAGSTIADLADGDRPRRARRRAAPRRLAARS